MTDFTLRDLYRTELTELRVAERQIIDALPTMFGAAASPELREALETHLQRTRIHLERLELLLKQSAATPTPEDGSAIAALLRAGDVTIRRAGLPQVRDAAIIAAAQHVEHFEIAGYGCARAHARQLNEDDAADLLQQTLDEEADADEALTRLAQAGINQAASEGALASGRRPRLRYVDVDDLKHDVDYRDLRVRNNAGENVGRIDGFVIDATGRPYYLVIDAGTMFVGRRYLVPVGRAELRRGDRTAIIDLDKDVLKRYPEFHRGAFISMSYEEARRYEWRILEAIDPAAARKLPSAWERDQLPYYRRPAWAGDTAWTPSVRETRTREAAAVRDEGRRSTHERDAVIARDTERVGRPADEDIR